MGINRGVNKVILLGNVGADPEVKHLDNGTVLAKFRLATNETYKNKDNENVTTTEWHNVVFFGRQAEVVEKYVKKGDALYVEGSIRTRSYEDKDNNKKYFTEIRGGMMQMLGSGKTEGSGDNTYAQSNETKSPETQNTIPEDDDDLPF
jgi:single-strand DNA-binding protein